jgi:hypothetical protein
LEPSFESGHWTLTLRPAGAGRWFVSAFLLLWLCGWAAGVVFALGALVATLGGLLAPELTRQLGVSKMAPEPPGAWLIAGFLSLWLAFWTAGGLAAMRELLSQSWGSERLEFDATGVRRERRAGPFRSRTEWPAASIRDVRLGSRGGLLLDTDRGAVALTAWGTLAERTGLRDGIHRALDLGSRASLTAGRETLPADWELAPSDEGDLQLTRRPSTRAAQARAAWIVAGIFTLVSGALAWEPISAGRVAPGRLGVAALLGVVGLACGGIAVWLAWGREAIAARPGTIEFRCRFGSRRWAETWRPDRLRVDRHADSDGDEWFALMVIQGARRRLILSTTNQPAPVLAVGRWLAERTGAPLEVDRTAGDPEPLARAA